MIRHTLILAAALAVAWGGANAKACHKSAPARENAHAGRHPEPSPSGACTHGHHGPHKPGQAAKAGHHQASDPFGVSKHGHGSKRVHTPHTKGRRH